jgi:hypothetical protein
MKMRCSNLGQAAKLEGSHEIKPVDVSQRAARANNGSCAGAVFNPADLSSGKFAGAPDQFQAPYLSLADTPDA